MSEEIKERIKAYYIANDIDKILNYITNLQQKVEQLEKELQTTANKCNQLENIRKEAIDSLNDKKQKILNTPDYRQYYIQGYETAIKNTHSTHDGIALEWVKNTIIKDCDNLLNTLNKGE